MTRTICSLALLLCAAGPATAIAEECRTDGRFVMGTVLEIRLCGASAAAFDAAYETALKLDALFTTWADDSAVLQLNRTAGTPRADVPAPLRAILKSAVKYGASTGGSFDVTVGPLVALWRDAARKNAVPTVEMLATARANVGADRIEFRDDGAVLLPAGTAIDLGGLAKGYALDRIADDLRAAGITDGFLDFGQSSLLALGAPPDGSSWEILVRRPDGPVVGVVSLRDVAASTSATFGRTSEIGGRRYSHVIDPRSGHPVPSDRLAFAIAPEASVAEAVSTALVVLGPAGLRIVEEWPGAEALIIDGTGPPQRTSGFDKATRFQPPPPVL